MEFFYEELQQKFRRSTVVEWKSRMFSLMLLEFIILCTRLISLIHLLAGNVALEVMIPWYSLQCILLLGQVCLLFITYGIDLRTVSIKIRKLWRKLIYGEEEFRLKLSELEPRSDAAIFRKKFNEFYFSKCFQAHSKDRRKFTSCGISPLGPNEEMEFFYQELQQKLRTSNLVEWQLCIIKLLQLILACTRLISLKYLLAGNVALEVMIPAKFLQPSLEIILYLGQGYLLIDGWTVSIKIRKLWRKLIYGEEEFRLKLSELESRSDAAIFCKKFNEFYFSKCFQALSKDRRWNHKVYKDCFWGLQLVDWLIEESVAKDDVEAEDLGQKLLQGGIIRHVEDRRHFHNAPYLYSFTKIQIHFLKEQELNCKKIL